MLLEYGLAPDDVLAVSGLRNKDHLIYGCKQWPEDRWEIMADVRDRFYEQIGEDQSPKVAINGEERS
jgi:hypothetical protein